MNSAPGVVSIAIIILCVSVCSLPEAQQKEKHLTKPFTLRKLGEGDKPVGLNHHITAKNATQPMTNGCQRATDIKRWSKGRFEFSSQMKECGENCMGDPQCAAHCMRKKDGYSKRCTRCMGQLVGCTVDKCLGVCMMGEGKDCKDCTRSQCDPLFAKCSGLPLSEITHSGAPPGSHSAKPKHNHGDHMSTKGHRRCHEVCSAAPASCQKKQDSLPSCRRCLRCIEHQERKSPRGDGDAAGCHITAWGNPHSEVAQGSDCSPNRQKIAVRCCEDGAKGATPSQCYRSSYSKAIKHCKAVSMRLCSKKELDSAQGTGCQFDEERVWTSDTDVAVVLEPGPVIPSPKSAKKSSPSPAGTRKATPKPGFSTGPVTNEDGVAKGKGEEKPPAPPPPPPPPITHSPFAKQSMTPHAFWHSPAFISVLCGIGLTLCGGAALVLWRLSQASGKVDDYSRISTNVRDID